MAWTKVRVRASVVAEITLCGECRLAGAQCFVETAPRSRTAGRCSASRFPCTQGWSKRGKRTLRRNLRMPPSRNSSRPSPASTRISSPVIRASRPSAPATCSAACGPPGKLVEKFQPAGREQRLAVPERGPSAGRSGQVIPASAVDSLLLPPCPVDIAFNLHVGAAVTHESRPNVQAMALPDVAIAEVQRLEVAADAFVVVRPVTRCPAAT